MYRRCSICQKSVSTLRTLNPAAVTRVEHVWPDAEMDGACWVTGLPGAVAPG